MEKKARKPRRTRLMIRRDIFDAVSEIVKKEGFSKLTINQIAEYADMEPIVIIRGFETVENIIEQYVERFDFWLSFFSNEKNKDISLDRESYKELLSEMLDIVFGKKEIQQLLAWELAEDCRLTRDVAHRRDMSSTYLNDRLEELFKGSDIDIRIISSILISASYYLSIHRNRATSSGIDMAGRPGKKIVYNGVAQLVDLLFDKLNKTTEKNIARKLLKMGDSLEKVSAVTGLTLEEVSKITTEEPQAE